MNNDEIDIDIDNDNIDVDVSKNEIVYRYEKYDDTEVRELIQKNADDIAEINRMIGDVETALINLNIEAEAI